jgi:hypothetical protein
MDESCPHVQLIAWVDLLCGQFLHFILSRYRIKFVVLCLETINHCNTVSISHLVLKTPEHFSRSNNNKCCGVLYFEKSLMGKPYCGNDIYDVGKWEMYLMIHMPLIIFLVTESKLFYLFVVEQFPKHWTDGVLPLKAHIIRALGKIF